MTSDTANPLDTYVANQWTTLLFVGVITAIIGVVVVAWPDKTLTVLSILFGIQLVVFGIFRLISAFASDAVSPGLMGFIGLLGIIAGVIVLRHPFETVAVLAVILGVLWIASGTIDVIGAIADPTTRDRGLVIFTGLIAVAAGVIVVAWPAPSITVIAWVAGVYLIVLGIVTSIAALRMRSLASS
jgi:uncharacterized membrane protein HdeD (DUF308 family)